jgi:hypothetical protein
VSPRVKPKPKRTADDVLDLAANRLARGELAEARLERLLAQSDRGSSELAEFRSRVVSGERTHAASPDEVWWKYLFGAGGPLASWRLGLRARPRGAPRLVGRRRPLRAATSCRQASTCRSPRPDAHAPSSAVSAARSSQATARRCCSPRPPRTASRRGLQRTPATSGCGYSLRSRVSRRAVRQCARAAARASPMLSKSSSPTPQGQSHAATTSLASSSFTVTSS